MAVTHFHQQGHTYSYKATIVSATLSKPSVQIYEFIMGGSYIIKPPHDFNSVPHVVVILTHTLFSLILLDYNLVTGMNYNVNI